MSELESITEAQWKRILAGRGAKSFRILAKPEQQEWAGKRAVSCGACRHTAMSGDPRRGFCVAQRAMVSLTFPKLCRAYEEDRS